MPEWLPTVLDVISLFVGIAINHSVFLYSQFYSNSRGYMWRTVGRLWGFLLPFSLIEWVIGCFFFFPTRPYITQLSIPAPIWAFVVGTLVATVPTALESILLPKDKTTVSTLKRSLTRVILKLNILLRLNFAETLEYCREQDVFDCQQPDGWGLNVSRQQVGRRIRMLYEFSKYKIAEKRRDPSLLIYDVNRDPWERFYLLVRHVGRRELREYIRNPVYYFPDWDGRERRRRVGSCTDRDRTMDTSSGQCRRYDDPKLIERIKNGTPGDVLPGPFLPEAPNDTDF